MEKKKRVLFMHQASTIGGGSYCLLNILKEIDKTNIQPVACLAGDGPLREEIEKLGIEVIIFRQMAAVPYNRTLCAISSLCSYYRVRKSINGFKRILADNKIDVVYLNNMMIYPYLKPAKECGCKTVLHCREHWPLNEHKTQLEWARNAVNNYCDKFIAINQYSASIFPDKEATIVYDWIDMDSRYKKLPMSKIFGENMTGKKVLLYTGGTSSIKGPDYILKAFTESVKGDEYRLLMLGCDSFLDRGLKHQIKMMLRCFGYHYWGYELQQIMNSDKRIRGIRGVYELCDLVMQSHCFVSYFRIPHANLALAENIILGNACIAADTEEAREYSGGGKYAMLVSPMNDLMAFSKQLNKFLENIDKWKEAARIGKDEVGKIFSPCKNSSILNKALSF